MEVKKIIIHAIEKEQGVSEAHLITSSHLLEIDDNINFLCEKLNDAFKKDERVIRTNFTSDIGTFQRKIKEYINTSTDEDFFQFTISSIERVRDLLVGRILASGGYFVFIEYEYRNSNYTSVFIVRDSEEVIFKRDSSSNAFVVNTTNIIKTEKLAMACRIDLNKFELDEDRYLHFTHKQTTTSDYFLEWIEAELANKSENDTKSLIHILNDIDLPLDPETGNTYEENKFRKHVYDFINASGKVANLTDLSRRFWDDPDILINYVEENNLTIDNEFRTIPKILYQLNKYEIESGKIKLSFSRKDFKEGTIRKGDNNQVIIESQELYSQFDKLDL